MRYPVEWFTPEEEAILRPHFTNLDRPVFCLVNLPETVKGALFARYSRYPGTLRRLFLEEFAADVPAGRPPFDGVEGERAAGLYERVFIGLRRRLDRPGRRRARGLRVGLEHPHQGPPARPAGRLSGAVDALHPLRPADGRRTAATATTATSGSASPTRPRWTSCSRIYSRSLESVQSWAAERWPRGEEPEAAWRRSIRAKSLDLLRGVLPAATLSHVGIFASGQAYEQLLLRLMASPLPEAREYGEHDPRRSSPR